MYKLFDKFIEYLFKHGNRQSDASEGVWAQKQGKKGEPGGQTVGREEIEGWRPVCGQEISFWLGQVEDYIGDWDQGNAEEKLTNQETFGGGFEEIIGRHWGLNLSNIGQKGKNNF